MSKLVFRMSAPKIGELIISHPRRQNAMTNAMWADLVSQLAKIADIPDLKALIISGQGEHFCTGADISEFPAISEGQPMEQGQADNILKAMEALANFPLPTIARIRGSCMGGGCGLALCCDIRFAADTARFAITPAKLGLIYPFTDIGRLIEAVGLANAKDMLFSAKVMQAREAENIGLIHQALVADKLDMHIEAYANKIAALSAFSTHSIKQMFRLYQSGLRTENDQTRALFYQGFTNPDFKKGYQAFLDKRKPDFD